MELSGGQQRVLFALVVLALAGLGIYLLGPAKHSGAVATAPPSPSASSSPAAAPSTPVASSVPPATVTATLPAPSAAAGAADIYQWLPFTRQDLTQAAHATLTFAAAWETFSYTETSTAYVAKMASVVTGGLAAQLKNGYDTLGVASQRSAQKQVSTSSGGIAQIRSFGSGAIMFVVNITQKLATTKGTSTTTSPFWISVVSGPAGWQVDNIEPAGAGNP